MINRKTEEKLNVRTVQRKYAVHSVYEKYKQNLEELKQMGKSLISPFKALIFPKPSQEVVLAKY